MNLKTPLTLIGHEGSPYSRKIRAVLRYRNIPYRWVVRHGPEYTEPPPARVPLLPMLVWHDAEGVMQETMVDSTPQIRQLETEYQHRSVIPANASLAFLNALIEDYADEWVTRFMFHYRWHTQESSEWAGGHLTRQIDPSMEQTRLAEQAGQFAHRQISRLWVVGSSASTAERIEAGYRRLLSLLEALLQRQRFLFGDRPASADFALHGQLSQLAGWDPLPAGIARELAPRVVAWTERLEDLSGWQVSDTDWLGRAAAVDALIPLLKELSNGYAPFMLANADAVARGEDQVCCIVDGAPWQQRAAAYQGKCLSSLRAAFSELSLEDRHWLRQALATCGLLSLAEGDACHS